VLIRNLIAGFLGLVLLLDAGCGAVNGLPVSNSGSVSAADVVHATPVPTPAVPRTAIQVKCGQLADSPLDAQKYGYGVALQSINARDAVMTCQSAASVPDYGAQYQFDYGRALLASGRYADAAKQFAAAAEAGNGLAAFTLAGLYEGGIGLKKDLEQASHWYQVAGSDGYADGFAAVGALYLLRVDPDYAKAVKWFAAASQDGSTMGAALMGWAYETGNGASKDPARAAALYTDAGTPSISGFVRASPWVVDAIFRLGLLEFRGNGVAKDPNAAVKWFEKAASVDHALSKTAMGYAYLTGAGYQQQYGYPSVLFRQAAEQGEPYAEYNLGLLYDAGLGVKTDRSRARNVSGRSGQWHF
jgi:TPR repeat protein